MRIVLGYAKFAAFMLLLVAMQGVMFIATLWLYIAFAASRADWFALAFVAAAAGQLLSNLFFDRLATRVPLMA